VSWLCSRRVEINDLFFFFWRVLIYFSWQRYFWPRLSIPSSPLAISSVLQSMLQCLVVCVAVSCSALQCLHLFFFKCVQILYFRRHTIGKASLPCSAHMSSTLQYVLQRVAMCRFFPRRQTLGEASLPRNAHPRVEVFTVMQCVVLRCSVYTSLFISVHFFLFHTPDPRRGAFTM